MGNVLYLRKQHPEQPEVVGFLMELLARAHKGEITGLVCAMAVEGQPDQVGLVGDFAEDRAYAMHAVKAARDLLALNAFDN